MDCKGEMWRSSLHIEKEFANAYIKFISQFDNRLWATTEREFVGFRISNTRINIDRRYRFPSKYSQKINYICKYGDILLISVWEEGGIYKVDALEKLEDYNCWENINRYFDMKGIPYYISSFDNRFWITEIGNWQGIYSFEIVENEIRNVNCVFSNTIDESDIEIKKIDEVLK